MLLETIRKSAHKLVMLTRGQGWSADSSRADRYRAGIKRGQRAPAGACRQASGKVGPVDKIIRSTLLGRWYSRPLWLTVDSRAENDPRDRHPRSYCLAIFGVNTIILAKIFVPNSIYCRLTIGKKSAKILAIRTIRVPCNRSAKRVT